MQSHVLCACLCIATFPLAFLMEPWIPLGDWRWGLIAVACVAPGLFMYRKEICEFVKGLKVGRTSNIGFFIGFPSKTRLVFVMKMPPIRLVKPVFLKGHCQIGHVYASGTLTVVKAPFHRRILYKIRRLLGDKQISHFISLAKKTVAFFRISFSILRFLTCDLNFRISSCSGVSLPFPRKA